MSIIHLPYPFSVRAQSGRSSTWVECAGFHPVEVKDVALGDAPCVSRRKDHRGMVDDIRCFGGVWWAPLRTRSQSLVRPDDLSKVLEEPEHAVSFLEIPSFPFWRRVETIDIVAGRMKVGRDTRSSIVPRLEAAADKLLLIDGYLHEAVSEPTWRVAQSPQHIERGEVQLWFCHQPRWNTYSGQMFRANRRGDAEAFAQALAERRGAKVVESDAGGELLDPTAPVMDDVALEAELLASRLALRQNNPGFSSYPLEVIETWLWCAKWAASGPPRQPVDPADLYRRLEPMVASLSAHMNDRKVKDSKTALYFAKQLFDKSSEFVLRVQTCEPGLIADPDAEVAEALRLP